MRKPTTVILAPALLLLAAGCVMPYNGPNGVRREVQQATGRHYDKTFAVTVGRSALAVARWAIDEDEEAEEILKGLKKVELGLYEAQSGREEAGGSGAVTAGILPGWSPLVELHAEAGEHVLVLSESGRDGSIRRLVVLVEDGRELIIVRIKGDLDRIVEEAIRYAFDQAERPDLADPSLEEYRRTL